MPYQRKYSGPLQPHRRTAKVPKALTVKAPRKPAAGLKLAKPAKVIISKLINSKLQEKRQNGQFLRHTTFDPAPSASNRAWQIFPEISQGDTRSDRQGSDIKITSCSLKGYLRMAGQQSPTSDTYSDIRCRLMVLSSKPYATYDDVLTNWTVIYDNLFKMGGNTYPADGNANKMLKPLNRELVTVHYDKTHLLNRSTTFQDTYGNLPVTEGFGQSQIPCVHKHFNIPLKFKNKVVKYVENGDLKPSNFGPFVVAMWSFSDGTAPTGASAACGIEFQSIWNFQA